MNTTTLLTSPSTLIIVGASERMHSLGEQVLTALQNSGFQGSIIPVNLRHKTVGGMKAYSQISRVPEHGTVLILTPPSSYEALFKACQKKKLTQILLMQDWESLNSESINKAKEACQHFSDGLNITALTPAGIHHTPTQWQLSLMPQSAHTGKALVIGHTPAFSLRAQASLQSTHSNAATHISIQPNISKTNISTLLDSLNTSAPLIIIEHNAQEPQRNLFSALRHCARNHTTLVHFSHHICVHTQLMIRSIAKQCGFFPTFNSDELHTAIHALSAPKEAKQLHIISNEPYGDLTPQLNPKHSIPPSETQSGYIGSHPSTQHYRGLANQMLNSKHTEALLAIITPNLQHNERNITIALQQLQQQHQTPLFISSPFSDGLLQFTYTQQATQAFTQMQWHIENRKQQKQTAKPWPAHIKTINLSQITQTQTGSTKWFQTLHLPELGTLSDSLIQLHYTSNSPFGTCLFAQTPQQTQAFFPPFSSLHAEQIIKQFSLKAQQKHIYQYLYSLNALQHNTTQPELIIHIGQKNNTCELINTEQTTTPNVFAPQPQHHNHTFTLKNGEQVLIRPLTPEDAQNEQLYVKNLSEQSRQTRFMAHIKELSPSTLAHFCNLDYHREAAFVAQNPDGSFAGVARFSCLQYPQRCEFGISVAENMHGQGLAFHLMQQIIQMATEQGYHTMGAEILKSNLPMLKLAEKLGFNLQNSSQDNELKEALLQLSAQTNNTRNKKGQ